MAYHLERCGMPLRDAVEVNCKEGETTDNQGADSLHTGFGVYVGYNYLLIN